MPKPPFQATAEGLPTRRAFMSGLVALAAIAALPVAPAIASASIHPDDVRLFERLLQHIEEAPPGFVAAFDGKRDQLWYVSRHLLGRLEANDVRHWQTIIMPAEDAGRLRSMLAEHGIFPPTYSARAF